MHIRLEPWTGADLDLLRRVNAPELMEHLGGPETEDQILARHQRYVALNETGRMFKVVLRPDLEPVGTIGYWERVWQGETVYETGWTILPEFQGRGLATLAAVAVAAHAGAEQKHRYMHAFPSADHPASNAICRKASFEFMGECDFEYPPGHRMISNDWRLDLTASPREGDGGAVPPPPIVPAGA